MLHHHGAGNETRTRDILLGKQVLYQLSYSRINLGIPIGTRTPTNGFGDRYAAITPSRYGTHER